MGWWQLDGAHSLKGGYIQEVWLPELRGVFASQILLSINCV